MIDLVAMTPQEFSHFRQFSVEQYASALARNLRVPSADAMAMASNESEGALPDGYYSEGHYFFHIEQAVTGERIGYVWYLANMRRKTAFLYDIFINQEARGMGIAREVIGLVEEKLRDLGVLSLRLNVFADNLTAKRLYEKAGFEPCNTIMQKQLT